jgi:hypothetical protein
MMMVRRLRVVMLAVLLPLFTRARLRVVVVVAGAWRIEEERAVLALQSCLVRIRRARAREFVVE